MNSVLQILKTQFANSPKIIAVVDTRCSFMIQLQDIESPYIGYNMRELTPTTKDHSTEYDLGIAVVAKTVENLFEVYAVVKDVMDTETTDFLSVFEGSSNPDITQSEDNYIIELNYNIKL